MGITLDPELEAAVNEAARRQGVSPEAVVLNALRQRFLGKAPADEPRDEWERRLRDAATDCGVAVSNEALSSEGLYD